MTINTRIINPSTILNMDEDSPSSLPNLPPSPPPPPPLIRPEMKDWIDKLITENSRHENKTSAVKVKLRAKEVAAKIKEQNLNRKSSEDA